MQWFMPSKDKKNHFKVILILFLALTLISVTAQRIYAQQVNARTKPSSTTLVTPDDILDGTVLFSFEVAYDPGTTEYGIPRNLTEGIAFDGQHICVLIWMIESENDEDYTLEIRKFDPLDGSLVSTVEIFKEIQGQPDLRPHLEWDGTHFWVTVVFNNPTLQGLFKIDPHSGKTLQHFPIPFVDEPGALAFDGENMWVAGRSMGDTIHLVNLTDGRDLSLLLPPTSSVVGLAVDGQFLWISYNDLFKVDPKTGSVLTSFSGPNYEDSKAITFDGKYLWVQTESDYIADADTGIERKIHSVHKVYIDQEESSVSVTLPCAEETTMGTPTTITESLVVTVTETRERITTETKTIENTQDGTVIPGFVIVPSLLGLLVMPLIFRRKRK